MLEKQIVLPLFIWNRLNLSWFGFFLTMGCINLYVAFSFSVDTWVTFKLFGATGLMLVFIIMQMMMLGKYLKDMPPVLAENVTSNEQDNLEKIENKVSKER
jgi:intracellular septation protein